jgi:hypothetical protein
MDRPTRTQTIKSFLQSNTHQDLAGLYNHDMECQCNVAQEGGRRIEGDFKGRQWHAFTNGIQTWKSFRIPYKANSEPEYTDVQMSFDFATYIEGIGMTGWDWVARVSRWVAYDFDAITGHSDKHARKLSEAELTDVAQRLGTVPWCTLRRSTSGKGLHLYVFLNPHPTANHTEHAALARAVLGQLSALTRFDFAAKVDICGGNMWVWHRKMKGTDGLLLLKAGTILEEIPMNWRDHVQVVSGRRRKSLPQFIEKQKQDGRTDMDVWFDELAGKQSRVPLDEQHTKLIEWLRNNNSCAWWDQDHWMLVTHTYHLHEAHSALGMRGKFETSAGGTEAPNDHNCFCFPLRKGAWAVRRYTPGVAESAQWEQDGAGWTRCFLNKEPDLKAAAKAFEGLEHPQGGFSFKQAEMAKQAAELLGANIELPPWISSRKALLKEHKDGRLVFEIEADSQSDVGQEGMGTWIVERNKYKRVFDVKARDAKELDVSAYDDLVRHVVSPGGEDCGWLLKSEGIWKTEPLTHVKHALTSMDFNPKEVNLIVGTNVMKCWTLVNRPFQDEYPTGREWNRNAPQLRYRPTENTENLSFPTWLRILNHIGKGLNRAVQDSQWCQANCILTGADYLKCWLASLFQYPLEPLPYLFLFSEQQGTGKSILHEALVQLVTHGVVRADQALVSQFNGELSNAIVAVVEETDLRRNKSAYNRIKDWVTARQLSIRALYQESYLIPNATHWIQCSNDYRACPIFPGDTRIVYCQVEPLNPEEMIPKRQLIPKLEKEAPDFLAELLNLEIPLSPDRLNIPVIVTQEKTIAEDANKSHLEQFIDDLVHHVTGRMIKFSEFYEKFIDWLDPMERALWTKNRMGRELPPKFPKGRSTRFQGQHFIGNVSWKAYEEGETLLPRLIRKGEFLEPENA